MFITFHNDDHDSLCAHKSLKLVMEQDISFSVYLSGVAIAMSTAGPCWDPVVVRTAPASRADLFQSVAPLKLPKDLKCVPYWLLKLDWFSFIAWNYDLAQRLSGSNLNHLCESGLVRFSSMVLTALVAAGAGVSGVGAGTYLTWNRRLGKNRLEDMFFSWKSLHVSQMMILFYFKKSMESMQNPQNDCPRYPKPFILKKIVEALPGFISKSLAGSPCLAADVVGLLMFCRMLKKSKYFVVEVDSCRCVSVPVGARLNLWISLLVWFQRANCKARSFAEILECRKESLRNNDSCRCESLSSQNSCHKPELWQSENCMGGVCIGNLEPYKSTNMVKLDSIIIKAGVRTLAAFSQSFLLWMLESSL